VTYQLLLGDCLETLKTLPDGCVQTCVTSPPYFGLRDYGTATWEGGDAECKHTVSHYSDNLKPDVDRPFRGTRTHCLKCGALRVDNQIGLEDTPDAYVAKLVDVFREVKRLLRDDGTLWLNLGDSYAATSKGTGGKTSSTLNAKRDEYGDLADDRKSQPWMDEAIKFDLRAAGLKPKDLIGIPWMVAFALRNDGWVLRSDIIWHKPNPMPESVTDRPTKSHEYIFLLSKSREYFYDADAIREPLQTESNIRNKASEGYTNGTGLQPASKGDREWNNPLGRNRRSVWTVTTKPYAEAHFATFPPDLIEPCILAGSKVGDTVLDPFSGSGTTGAVALKHGRKYIGCELNPDYIELAHRRITQMQPMLLGVTP
jgi:DNA modification methylase